MIAVSIVSHGQAALVSSLLRDLAGLGRRDLRIVLTLNIPEAPPDTAGLDVEWLRNERPLGFGANHNQALKRTNDPFACILNPDVRLSDDPFPALLDALRPERVAIAAPRVLNSLGSVENSARRYPTVASLARRLFQREEPLDYPDGGSTLSPDWVAGMFMLAKRSAFDSVGGFDERYFLYYEDVDLCRRLTNAGYGVALVQAARVIHDAQRTSHRSLRYLRWHLQSVFRYLFLSQYR